MTLIYLIAGEASGDVLGARLMRAITAQRPGTDFVGIGGDAMAAQGLTSLFPQRELALMGLLEILPRLRRLKARFDQTRADIAARRPDIVVTIDSPDFTLRLLRAIAPLNIARAHYVAPQAWAWRTKRMKQFPGLWDQLLCLLPFEPEFFARHNLPATFVGHPVLESGAGSGNASGFRKRHRVAPDARIITIMPGSRRSEASRLLPVFGAALQRLVSQIPHLQPVIPVSEPAGELVSEHAKSWPARPILLTGPDEKRDGFAASAAALTKSGTSTLELALAQVPMLVAYRVNPLSAAIARRLVVVPYASLLNLLAKREIVPELIQQDCTPDRLAEGLRQLLTDPLAADAQRTAFGDVLDQLRPPSGVLPSDAAATAVLELLDRAGSQAYVHSQSSPPAEEHPV